MIKRILFSSATLFIAIGLFATPASASKRATVGLLDGKQFVSTSVKGPGKVPAKVKLAFNRGAIYGEDGVTVIKENGPVLVANAGCNTMAAPYVGKKRLRWTQPAQGTAMGCPNEFDRWISSRLKKGFVASVAGRTLTLRIPAAKGKRGVVIRLAQKNWFG